MQRLEVTYFEVEGTRRRDELVDAAFDLLFEKVLRDYASPRLEEKTTP
jgi:hypothetical protein